MGILRSTSHNRETVSKVLDEEAQKSGNQRRTKRFTPMSQMRATLFSSWLNIALFPLVAAGFAVRYTGGSPLTIFIVNFFAILLLASWLSYAMKELALRAGGIAMAFVVVLSNAIQFIVTITALVQDQILIIQTSLVGPVISNMVLLTGLSLLFGGHNRIEQNLDRKSVNTQLNYLFLIIGILGIGSMWNASTQVSRTDISLSPDTIKVSRASSVILLVCYTSFLCWALSGTVRLYSVNSQKNGKLPGRSLRGLAKAFFRRRQQTAQSSDSTTPKSDSASKEKETVEPQLSLSVMIFILVVFTALIGFCAIFAVDSITSMTSCDTNLSQSFVGYFMHRNEDYVHQWEDYMGVILIVFYMIVAVGTWFYPNQLEGC